MSEAQAGHSVATDVGARALAALRGLAIGDALGMPTQLMSREEVARRFGAVDWFLPAPNDHPIAAGLPAGSVTDDTEQAVLLGRLLVQGRGRIDPALLASALVEWEDGMRARGSLDLLGPSTKRAVEAVLAGEPVEQAGRYGATNGAAMRIAPVGIATGIDDLTVLVDRVEQASLVSHNTGIALAGAAAVAAAVSAGLSGIGYLEPAVAAARLAAGRGHWVAGADVAERIVWVGTLVDPARPADGLELVYRLVGTSLATQESVPAAFAILALYPDDPWAAVRAAAGLGGDADTIAAMVGAIAGARVGSDAFPFEAIDLVTSVNRLELAQLVEDLLELRCG